MEIAYNSSNPYNFTFAVHPGNERYADVFLTLPYSPFHAIEWLFPGLIFRYLKNVRFRYTNSREIIQRLSTISGIKWSSDYEMKYQAIENGIIDSTAQFYTIDKSVPGSVHVSPITYFQSFVIVSTISSDSSRRESSEELSVQGLPSPVWALVGFALLIVSGLASYLSFKNRVNHHREKPFNSWTNSVWIYAADILNNCVAGVVNPGPGRHLRSWWLLGVMFLIQFWSAGMKSDLLLDSSTYIDSLKDLFSKPELVCLVSRFHVDSFHLSEQENDPRYQKIKVGFVDDVHNEDSIAMLSIGSGVIMDQELTAMWPNYPMFKRLKETKRIKYIGKRKYAGHYAYMEFSKRLPRAIKEDVDYLTSRLTETRQTEPRLRKEKFDSREYIFDPTVKSASTMSWSAQSFNFLLPVFRIWMIGNSLAICVFCVEFFRSQLSRRRRVKVYPYSIGIWIRT